MMPEVRVAAPPDGGWGWVVCFACFMTHVLVDGIVYSFGILFVELLDYFKDRQGNTALIASLCYGICLVTGPINAAASNHFGNQKVIFVGTCTMVASFIASTFAPNIYYLYVTFSIAGWGFGMINLPSMVCLTRYFENRRAFAVGLSVSGSGIGTFIFSPLTRFLIEAYTWKGALLIQSGLIMNCIACGLVSLPLDHPVNRRNKQNYTTQSSRGGGIELCENDPLHAEYEENIQGSLNDDSELCERANLNSKHEYELSRPKETNEIDHKDHSYHHDAMIQNTLRYAETGTGLGDVSLPLVSSMDTNTASQVQHDVQTTEPVLSEGDTNAVSPTVKDTTEISNQDGREKTSFVRDLVMAVKKSFNFRVMTNMRLLVFLVSTFFYGIGYFVPYVYIPVKAQYSGIDSYRSAWLISTLGMSNTVGRIVFGFLSDKKCVNRLVLYNTALVLCGLGTVICPFFDGFGPMVVYAFTYGLFSGITIALNYVVIFDMIGTEMLADAIGMRYFFSGIANFMGPPLVGWLVDTTNNYTWTFVAAGIAILLGGAVMYAIPFIKGSTTEKAVIR